MSPKHLVVMKFGGTSVADPEKIQRAAERAIAARRKGLGVVAVISAPGEMTDELLDLAGRIDQNPDSRELDMLLATGEQVSIALFAMACKARKVPAISLTGAQAGILAEGEHTQSQITSIRPGKILSELKTGKIVAVAGFQGVNSRLDITTLGRGGSDLSAVALASALKADHCEIFSDVKGVYTADPRLVPEARKIKRIPYAQMLELSASGAQVMQARSIELAKRCNVTLHIRSAFHACEGTWVVRKREKTMEKTAVASLAVDKNAAQLSIVGLPHKPGATAEVFAKLAAMRIPSDMILQGAPSQGVYTLSFMTPRNCAAAAQTTLETLAHKLGAVRVERHEQVVKLSAIGSGFYATPQVAATLFETLARSAIPIRMISSSDLKISCVLEQKHTETALRALHRAFGLGR